MPDIIFSGIGGAVLGAFFTSIFYTMKLSNHISEIKATLTPMEKRLERIDNRLEKLEEKK